MQEVIYHHPEVADVALVKKSLVGWKVDGKDRGLAVAAVEVGPKDSVLVLQVQIAVIAEAGVTEVTVTTILARGKGLKGMAHTGLLDSVVGPPPAAEDAGLDDRSHHKLSPRLSTMRQSSIIIVIKETILKIQRTSLSLSQSLFCANILLRFTPGEFFFWKQFRPTVVEQSLHFWTSEFIRWGP